MALQKKILLHLLVALLVALVMQWIFLQWAGIACEAFFPSAVGEDALQKQMLVKAAASSIGLLLASWILYAWLYKKTLITAGFQLKGFAQNIPLSITVALGILGLSAGILIGAGHISFTRSADSRVEIVPAFLIMGMVALAEELFIRGCIQRKLANMLPPYGAWLLTAAIFMLMHMGNPGQNLLAMPGIFIGGLLLGVNYMFSGNLWFGIGLHWCWNFVQGCLLGFPVSGIALPSLYRVQLLGPSWITGGNFGLEASVCTTVLQLAALWMLYQIFSKNYQRKL
ncbi:MAG TPA: CPBP family intramembrane glutamic endopeptidase [Phnomibacter sp.]|nr:CPBP family intramembrane glutamic endopeptidase [Phnomibacter sp.]